MTEPIIGLSIILSASALVVSWITYRHNRKFAFQDKLFQIKIEAYNEITKACFDAYKNLDPESEPFVEIYTIKDAAWRQIFEKKILAKVLIGEELETLVQKHNIFLSSKILDKLDEYAGLCISYVVQYAHKDTGLNVNTHDRIWELYVEMVGLMRNDLHVDNLDRDLFDRISDKKL